MSGSCSGGGTANGCSPKNAETASTGCPELGAAAIKHDKRKFEPDKLDHKREAIAG